MIVMILNLKKSTFCENQSKFLKNYNNKQTIYLHDYKIFKKSKESSFSSGRPSVDICTGFAVF